MLNTLTSTFIRVIPGGPGFCWIAFSEHAFGGCSRERWVTGLLTVTCNRGNQPAPVNSFRPVCACSAWDKTQWVLQT